MGGQARQQQDLVPGPLAPGEAHCGHGQVTPGEKPDRPHQGMPSCRLTQVKEPTLLSLDSL